MKRKTSNTSAASATPGKKKADEIPPGNPFWKILEECGLRRSADGSLSIDDVDQFRRRVESRTSADADSVGSIDRGFSLVATSGTPDELESALCPLQSDRITTVNPSVLRVLLGIVPVQQQLLSALASKMIDLASSSSSSASDPRRLAQLIISHFQWLPVRDSEAFAHGILDVVEAAAAPEFKRDLILALPTIVEERHHSIVAEKLKQMIQSFPSETLEAISHLTLSNSLSTEVTKLSLSSLASAKPQDLPALVGFILNATPESSAKEVAERIRSGISLEQLSKKKGLDERELLDVLQFGLRVNKHLASALLESIEDSGSPSPEIAGAALPIRAFDLMATLVLFSVDVWQRRVFKMIDESPRIFSEHLIRDSFKGRAAALQPLFHQILALAERLLRTGAEQSKLVGGIFYIAAAETFDPARSLQDVLSFLVTHLSSSSKSEVGVAITVLEEAASKFPRRLEPHSAVLKSTVDHVDKLSLQNVGRLYSVFAAVSYVEVGEGKVEIGQAASADLHLLLQKQLASADERIKKIGVAGAIALVMCTGAFQGTYEEALKTFLMARNLCHSVPTVLAFLYDELARALAGPHRRLRVDLATQMAKTLTSELQRDFLAQGAADEESSWFALERMKAATGAPAVSIYPIVKSPRRPTIAILCPLFRLMAMCVREVSGSSGDVDMMLSLPVAMYEPGTDDKKEEGEAVCLSLFHAIQWFRELINVFHEQDAEGESAGSEAHALLRLDHIQELEGRLRAAYKKFPTTRIPAPPETLPAPTAIPKKAFPKRTAKSLDGTAVVRPLEHEAIVDVISMITKAEPRGLPHKAAPMLRYLLCEMQSTLASAIQRDKKAAATASVLSRLLPSIVTFLHHQGATGGDKSGDDKIDDSIIENLNACSIHALSFLRQILSAAIARPKRPDGTADPFALALIRASIPHTDDHAASAAGETMEDAVRAAFDGYEKMSRSITTIEGAAGATYLLEALCGAAGSAQRVKLSSISQSFLARSWNKCPAYDDCVRFLLERYIELSADPLAEIESVVTHDLERLIRSNGNIDEATTSAGVGVEPLKYSTLSKETIPTFYRAILKLIAAQMNSKRRSATPKDAAIHIIRCTNEFSRIILATWGKGVFAKRPKEMASDTMRIGASFLTLFVKSTKVLTDNFAEVKTEVLGMLRNLQMTSRRLHKLCQGDKVATMSQLARLVPGVKRALESLIYSVKMMLSVHGLLTSETFDVGTLKGSPDKHTRKRSRSTSGESDGGGTSGDTSSRAGDEDEEEEEPADE